VLPQLVKKSRTLYWNWKLITLSTSARHIPLSWYTWIQFTPSHPISLWSALLLSSNLRLVCPSLPNIFLSSLFKFVFVFFFIYSSLYAKFPLRFHVLCFFSAVTTFSSSNLPLLYTYALYSVGCLPFIFFSTCFPILFSCPLYSPTNVNAAASLCAPSTSCLASSPFPLRPNVSTHAAQ